MNCGSLFWLALRLTLLAIVVFYFVMYIVRQRRLRGRKGDSRTDAMFWVVVALALIRVFARLLPLSGWNYHLVRVLPGIAAAIATPGLMKELTKLKANTELS
jgi:hypothetical protein